jgi:RNA polymerase-binding transcription factor DksA
MLADASLDALKRRLFLRATQLQQEIGAVRARVEERAPGEVSDGKDVAGAAAEAVVADAEVARDLAELRDIRDARQRLDEGRYGSCCDCGEGIDLDRLLAQPQARRCMRCQDRSERGLPPATGTNSLASRA